MDWIYLWCHRPTGLTEAELLTRLTMLLLLLLMMMLLSVQMLGWEVNTVSPRLRVPDSNSTVSSWLQPYSGAWLGLSNVFKMSVLTTQWWPWLTLLRAAGWDRQAGQRVTAWQLCWAHQASPTLETTTGGRTAGRDWLQYWRKHSDTIFTEIITPPRLLRLLRQTLRNTESGAEFAYGNMLLVVLSK